MVFGDTDVSTVANWRLDDGENVANTITLAVNAGLPTLTANALGAGAMTTIATRLESAVGLAKAGAGTLVLARPNGVSGPLNVSQGTLRVGPGASLDVTTVSVASSSAQLNIAGGSFSASGPATLNPRPSLIVVDSGTADFMGGVTSVNFRDPTFRVTGGTVTATSVNFPRTSDSSPSYSSGLIIQGGHTTIGTIGLGTANSWGVMSVEGGELDVTGPLTAGYQVTAGRGADFRVTGGALNVRDGSLGIVMSRNPGTQPNNVSRANFLGGVSTVERFTLGYDASVTAGSATITVNGGALYLGSGGIVKNGIGGFVTNLNFTSGVVGAKADWSTALPITFPASGNVAIKAADASDVPHAITLNGALSGAGGFSKTGGGALVLTAASAFTGPARVEAGVLEVDDSLAAGGPVDVNGGTLTGVGTIGRAIMLGEGGRIVPGGAASGSVLTAESLTWNGAGQLGFDLAAGHQLVLTGVVSKSGAPGLVTLSTSAPLPVGTVVPLVVYGSTDLLPGELAYGGPPGYLGVFLVGPTNLQFLITGAGPTAEFTNWAYLAGLPAGQDGAADDPDNDGMTNLLEFVLGCDPLRSSVLDLVATTVVVNGQSYPAISFVRRIGLGGVTSEVLVSGELSFSSLLGSVEVSASARGDGMEDVIVRSLVPLRRKPRQFFRLAATLPAN
jgi:rhamnogalacturonan endolyase